MDIELFLLELAESNECKTILYKRLAIQKLMGIYFSQKVRIAEIDPFMIPFAELIKSKITTSNINIDELVKYMIENDPSTCSLFAASTWFTPKSEISAIEYMSIVAKQKVITPYVDTVDLDAITLMVVCYIFDNLTSRTIDIERFVEGEIFNYQTNQYNLTKVNGATFKLDGLIFDNKGYYYNVLTNKTLMNPLDTMVGFARIISDEASHCDILYRLDERLSMPANEYRDYTGAAFAKYRGPQFDFSAKNLTDKKTIIVHYDERTLNKLLMVIKQDIDQSTGEEFLHVEIETLPYVNQNRKYVITTFLHGMYYLEKGNFTHIDYANNQYSTETYLQKYADSKTGLPIDQYTETKSLHYKIWCVENGSISKETWYKLMIISLPELYQKLLNEILE